MTTPPNDPAIPAPAPADFVRDIVAADNQSGKHGGRVVTRFPPEPNGYLHIGHAKSICLNFGIAGENSGGICHLRFDDTNPAREDVEYVDSIQEDVNWLGFDWGKNKFYASDYFGKLYDFAVELIKMGKAYVCDLTADEMIHYRGAPTVPGRESPFRNRTIEENLDLFARMRAGEFPDGAKTLRAKIDMASPNIHLRDPAIYRIRKVEHHRTGNAWCIYPMYDYAHSLSDSIEGITHSICTLEFEVHRPLYDWILNELKTPCHPQQIEFARLNLSYTVMSKRKLLQLVEENLVTGWDDPRMPTVAGLRRRGVTPEAIRHFCARIGVTKYNGLTDIALLEHSVREDLNKRALRVMAVLRPVKVVLTNYPDHMIEELDAVNNPEDPSAGSRKVPFSRVLYIERDDFMEVPAKKFFRLSPGNEVRLRYAYIIKCVEVVKDANGEITELQCTIDPDSKSGGATASRKIKGTIHWVSAAHAVSAEVRMFDRLFTVEQPDADEEGRDFKTFLNPNSLETLTSAKLEPSLADAKAEARYQFERLGYFRADPKDSQPGKLVFNRIVSLRDSWAKEAAK
ncbi:MAG TPA: glutamine--tRNA ligase/YqeY domain fusion protein [Verrucomicrobiae bacterium]|jgi:glutaminyl-tRNA synthetase|nr:glutamine--tRNA ligase/YqeY domain fusion protein [Verrucomicrobiae bacterium]